ncbi:MAG: FliH/SctL family protein [Thermodesulfobacteriota bacterium]
MFSSKIYKSGSSVNVEDLVLKQLHSPEAIKELLALEKVRKKKSAADSKDSLPRIEKEAYEKGFQAGERAGLEIAEEKKNAIIKRIEPIYNEIAAFKEDYYKENKEEILSLIINVARKVVCEELKINEDVAKNVLENAIEAVSESEKVEIRLSPEDIEYHREKNPDFLSGLETAGGFSVVADQELSRGSVLIESNHSEIDARIEVGINNIEKAVKEAFQDEPDAH